MHPYTNGVRLLLLCALGLFAGTKVATATEIDLGETDRVARLFSHPNNCHVVCYLPQTLEQTVELYLRDSLKRDGHSDADVSVFQTSGRVKVTISGAIGREYAIALPAFLSAGDKAYDGAQRLLKEGKWRYNWKFYLPLGLPLTDNKSVQLLHFPPDYVLEHSQDYLAANTTKRWAELLILNGASPDETDMFQAIIDIAPISAPASDGKLLDGTYGYFQAFIDDLLRLWTSQSNESGVRPVVAFGLPVREYLKDRYGLSLKILTYAEIDLGNDTLVPLLAANHPSRFYNAINALLQQKPAAKADAVRLGIAIAQDDLIAACWQISMATGAADGRDVLAECKSRWRGKTAEVCEIVIEQRFKGDSEASKVCGGGDTSLFSEWSDERISEVETLSIIPEVN
ncbi:hypothetical protein [Parvibaculum sp.]|uniref:hypothetical protein n=1 Tax=Parvibaculum sp. TaxID=2024848 RepID=UPI0026099B7F|nr:hypothetical protein [Parvibaculum sp.]MCW5726214.1 hypothetical protein [Parvibaculum sp.]